MHPIIEFMYPDFMLEATDQLFNHIAKSRYMFGGEHEVPIIARTQIARGRGYGPQHSCDPAALFTCTPAGAWLSPTTPADYVGCWNAAVLCRAIRCSSSTTTAWPRRAGRCPRPASTTSSGSARRAWCDQAET